jgi:quaternary ammonium compound-resistance protein SugE
MNPWITLIVAALFEIAWATGIKSTQGFTRLWPSAWVLAALAASMYFLAVAARSLPIGTAYAIWTGIGAVGTAVGGIVLLGESASPLRLLCIACIAGGVIGLKATHA